MKKVFAAAKAKLKTTPGVKHVALFRNQFRKLEDNKQIPFPCPAVLLEFMNVTYLTNTDNTQTGSGILRVYLAEFDLVKSDEDVLLFRETVHKALQGLRDEEHFSRLNRIAENPDPEFEHLTVWTMDYDVDWNDDSARPTYQSKLMQDLKITRV